ncbi:MAG: hypothetical protein HY681_09715 [Chloroflexi bacterium]|nr:hypothetical protein [Chloroflexota bacterium]
MSKLLDRLDQITRGPVRTLGFGPAATREATPTMALLVLVEGSKAEEAQSAVQSGADAVVLAAPGMGNPSAPEGAAWGVEATQLDKAKADALRGQGCDFLVFGIENTLVEALEEGDCTRVLRVPPTLEESQLRVIEDLPVDVVLAGKPAPEGPLCLAHLLAIANVRSATSRYLLLEWNGPLSAQELEHLRGMGVDGILLRGAGGEALPATVAELHERIAGLPPRRPRSDKEGRSPILPRLDGGMGPARQRAPEPDEEEEEEEY